MNDAGRPRYDPQAIEPRRQELWRERDAFRTPAVVEDAPHLYIKPSAPFTSGNIHMGHVRSYSIGDAYARFRRARGDAVLFAFGFDAFGLPAELGAIASGERPSDWVKRCAEHMRRQLERLGFSFDWERSFFSSDPIMYRWSQWLFLILLEAGLVYRGTGTVDWCDTCQTTLASIQVEDGRCWRCHNPVRLIHRAQWNLRLSAYVPENDARLEELESNWDDTSLASQRFVLGRVEGVEIDLRGLDGGELAVFTPHGDALELARFVLISPDHPAIEEWARDPQVRERLEELRSSGLERSSRDAGAIALIDTGRRLAAPVAGGSPLPLLVSPIVDGRFGPTAVLGIPERDHSDELLAARLEDVLAGQPAQSGEESPAPGTPRAAVRYKADDFSISRQRSWGTPIPIVYCETCGAVPVEMSELPVLLPLEITPTGSGNTLAECEEFVRTSCPSCSGPARRETDTLDCHFDALWLWIPACVPAEARALSLEDILALPDLRHWLPCERVVAGSDSGNFVFDQRIVTKALRDIGPLAFLSDGEPFAGCTFHEMVISDGRKMSKHLGNVVDPDELVERYGADTVRLAVLYAANPQKSLNWSDSAVLRCHRFLTHLHDYVHAHASSAGGAVIGAAAEEPAQEGARDSTEHLRKRLAGWCETGAEKITENMQGLEMHTAVRNLMRLFDRIRDFEKRVLARSGELTPADNAALLDALAMLVRMLGPLTPHLSEELWSTLGNEPSDAPAPWPRVSFEVPA
jgi:leucyl-tRNA synthetase